MSWLRRGTSMPVCAIAFIFAAGCTEVVSGRISAAGGPDAGWALRPNRCKLPGAPSVALASSGVVAVAGSVVDLYYAGKNAADTEVVVIGSDTVLVRIPGRKKMVVLKNADCAIFDVNVGHTGYSINEEIGTTGHARLDCNRPEIGHVSGEVSFTCF